MPSYIEHSITEWNTLHLLHHLVAQVDGIRSFGDSQHTLCVHTPLQGQLGSAHRGPKYEGQLRLLSGP